MKEYREAELEIIEIEAEDIVTNSLPNDENPFG